MFIEEENKIQELHEDLVPYLTMMRSFPALRHPLVYSIPHSPFCNEFVNRQYEQKKKAVDGAIKNKKYSTYVFLHERPYRINAFSDIYKELTDKEYHELLSHIWIDSENIWQNKRLWKKFLTYRKESRSLFMSKKDKKVFGELPATITVYRGYSPGKNKVGFSYTLNEEKAGWFANRFNQGGKVAKRVVNKSDIFAYVNERNEQEIIII